MNDLKLIFFGTPKFAVDSLHEINLNNKIRELKNVSEAQKTHLELEIKQLKKHLNKTWNEWIQLTQVTTKKFKLAHAH